MYVEDSLCNYNCGREMVHICRSVFDVKNILLLLSVKKKGGLRYFSNNVR
jgi:hypothetical protein